MSNPQALLLAMGYPRAQSFNQSDEQAIRKLAVWLENVKVQCWSRHAMLAHPQAQEHSLGVLRPGVHLTRACAAPLYRSGSTLWRSAQHWVKHEVQAGTTALAR